MRCGPGGLSQEIAVFCSSVVAGHPVSAVKLVEYYALENLKDDRFTTVLQGKKLKHTALKLDDRKKRIQTLLRCYLRQIRNAYAALADIGAFESGFGRAGFIFEDDCER